LIGSDYLAIAILGLRTWRTHNCAWHTYWN